MWERSRKAKAGPAHSRFNNTSNNMRRSCEKSSAVLHATPSSEHEAPVSEEAPLPLRQAQGLTTVLLSTHLGFSVHA